MPDTLPGQPSRTGDNSTLMLLLVNQQSCWRRGERVLVEAYLAQQPPLSGDSEAVLELILHEVLLRQECGETPALAEYQQRFPDLAEQLQIQFEVENALAESRPYSAGLPRTNLAPASPLGPESGLASAPLFSGYEVLGELGRGGMGVVYKARHVALKRLVALKMIRGGRPGPEELARFRREAEAVARLQHPNIVQIYEVGEHDGNPFFSLEYCPGGSLNQKLRGVPLPPEQAAQLVEILARAVDAAHQKKVIHRDLKPANILLTDDGTLKITDFGLARQTDEAGQTTTGTILGTPSYMAPEQAGGKSHDVGSAADVYALGAILYELLTGRPPFKAATALETLLQVQTDEPAPPSRLQSKTPRDLETICLKCLEKEAPRRYPTAQALADDVRRFLNREPIRARPVSSWERLAKWARRERARAALVGVSLLTFWIVIGVVIAGLSVSYHFSREELKKARAHEEARRSCTQSLLAAQQLVDRGRYPEAETELAFARKILAGQPDVEAADLQSEIERRHALVARKLAEQAEQRIEADRLETFRKPYDDALFRVTQFTGQDRAENQTRAIASARTALALYGLDGQAGTPEAKPALLERVRLVLGDAEQARLANACYELLLIWADAEATPLQAKPGEKPRSGVENALRVLTWADRLAQANHLNTRAFHVRKARCLARARGAPFDPAQVDKQAPARPQSALDWFLEGLDHYQEGTQAEQDRRTPGESFHQASAACGEALKRQDAHYWARYVLAMCHLRARRWVEAKLELTLCIRARPELTWPRLMRGFASSELGALLATPELAEAEFDQAEIDFHSILDEDRDLLTQYVGLVNRGVLNIRRQRWQEAVNDLRQAVKTNPKGFQGYLNLAQALQKMKRFTEALAALDQAIQQVPDLPVLYENRAKLQLELNDRQSARKDFDRAIAREPAGARSDRLVKNLVEVGRLQLRDHQYRDAQATLERALKVNPRYFVAQRFRAEALLGQNRHAEAGQALDAYMQEEKAPSAEVYTARGLIHAATGQLSRAIQCYSAALQRNPEDSEALHYRGWAYLLIDANQLALTDFEACLKQNAKDADALVGRGNARIRCARLEEALTDAAEATNQGSLTDRLLYNLACIYAEAKIQLQADPRTPRNPGVSRRLAMCEERAVASLRLAVEKLPADRRASFWRNKVEIDPALAPLRRLEGYLRLARQYHRPSL